MELTGNINISDNLMQILLNDYKDLETIILNNTPLLNNLLIEDYKKKYPKIRIIRFEL